MAILYKATLLPSKLDLLREYLTSQSSLSEHVGDDLVLIGAYRFDDPAGQVGIETHLVTSSTGDVLQVPVMYRNDPLDGAEGAFIGTMEHSVLGTRWVYDACIDPIYAGELLRTILTGGTEVEQYYETSDGRLPRESTVQVRGTGSGDSSPHVMSISVERSATASRISTGDHTVVVSHVLIEGEAPSELHLNGTWADRDGDIVLARLTS